MIPFSLREKGRTALGVAIDFHPEAACCCRGRTPVPSTSIETSPRIFTDRALTPLLRRAGGVDNSIYDTCI